MRIEHIAICTGNLERLKIFYTTHFDAQSSPLYHNKIKNVKSCFLTFDDGARLEIMQKQHIPDKVTTEKQPNPGYIHMALSAGSRTAVDILTANLRRHGVTVTSNPRQTGDGYYESTILDPDGNTIEITV